MNRTEKEEKLVEQFNSKYPVGSSVEFRKSKVSEYKTVTVKHEAYMSPSGCAVAIFNDVSGCCSIDPMFIKY